MPIARFNPQEALVCAMVLMAASDRQMTDALGALKKAVDAMIS